MTTLREAAQQALEALKMHSTHYECDDSFYSCPAHEENDWREGSRECTCGADEANAAIAALQAALEQPEPEPVAWHYTNNGGVSVVRWERSPRLDADLAAAQQYPHAHKVTPLYATPPQRKPLSDDALWAMWDADLHEDCPDFRAFKHVARAVEAAHGIEDEK